MKEKNRRIGFWMSVDVKSGYDNEDLEYDLDMLGKHLTEEHIEKCPVDKRGLIPNMIAEITDLLDNPFV